MTSSEILTELGTTWPSDTPPQAYQFDPNLIWNLALEFSSESEVQVATLEMRHGSVAMCERLKFLEDERTRRFQNSP